MEDEIRIQLLRISEALVFNRQVGRILAWCYDLGNGSQPPLKLKVDR